MFQTVSRLCDRVEEDLDALAGHPVGGPILTFSVAVGTYGALRIFIHLVVWWVGGSAHGH